MKKIITLLLIVSLFSCTTKKDEYRISGTVSGIHSVKVRLFKLDNGAYKVIDSVQSSQGKFVFTGHVEQPDRYYIQLQNTSGYAGFFLENSDIQIKLNKDDLSEPVVTGSAAQEVYESFLREFKSVYIHRIDSVRGLYKNVKNDEQRNVVNNLYDQTNREAVDFIVRFSKEQGHSVATLYIARRYMLNLVGYTNEDLTRILNSIDPELSNTQSYKLYSNWVDKRIRVEIGKPFVDFAMNDTLGNPISVSSIHAKYLLIDFWSSSCGPCREMNPFMIKLYNKYKSRGFEILGVSFDRNRENWVQAIRKDKITWLQVSSLTGWKNVAQDIYGIQYIPQNVLINAKGIIIAKNLKREELARKLEEVLGK